MNFFLELLWLPAAGFLFLTAAGTGARCLDFFRLSFDPADRALYAGALGLVLLSSIMLLLGLSAQLTSAKFLVSLALLGLFGFQKIPELMRGFKDLIQSFAFLFRPVNWILLIPVVLCWVFLAAGLTAPETANDSLCYHLHIPKIFIEHHKIFRIPYEINTFFPYFMEMLYAIGLLFKSTTLAKSFHLIAGLLSAGLICRYTRKWVSPELGALGALLFLLAPGLFNQMASTYVDTAFSFFALISLTTLLQWRSEEKTGWLVLAGIFCGVTVSIKFLGVVCVLASSLLLWDKTIRDKTFRHLFLFLISAAAVGSYWYIRSYLEWGNPVYPYFYSLFGTGDPTIHYDDIGVTKTLLNFLFIPFTLSFRPDVFEGFGDQIGPAFLAFAPLGFMAYRKIREIRHAACYAFIYLVCWFLLGQSSRFLYPAIAVISLGIPLALSRLTDNGRRLTGARLILAACFTLYAGIAAFHFRDEIKLAAGALSHHDYLSKKIRIYRAADFTNRHLPAQTKILVVKDVLLYSFDRTAVREDIYAEQTGYYLRAESPSQVFDQLIQKGFTHILITDRHMAEYDLIHPLRIGSVRTLNEKARLEPKFTYDYTDPLTNSTITYTLFELLHESKT